MRTPMKRFGNVEELAGAAIFLASDAASFVSGEIIAVDGGFLGERRESITIRVQSCNPWANKF